MVGQPTSTVRDLYKAYLKDGFSLLNIGTIVDATIVHSMFFFLDWFSCYNQIKMDFLGVEKTSFPNLYR